MTEPADLPLPTPNPNARGKSVRLTERGLRAKSSYQTRLAATESLWRERFGAATIEALKSALAEINLRPRGNCRAADWLARVEAPAAASSDGVASRRISRRSLSESIRPARLRVL